MMNKRIIYKGEYHILHDSEYEMLTIGKNETGEYLITSFLKEDIKEEILYYLHVLVQKKEALDFATGKISYLAVLRKADVIFQVKKEYNYQMISDKLIHFDELSKNMKPLKNASFPIEDIAILSQLFPNVITDKKFAIYIILENYKSYIHLSDIAQATRIEQKVTTNFDKKTKYAYC